MLPNWIIAGAPKAATSSLFRWLTDHPQVTSSIEKETYYFADPGTHMYRRGNNFDESGLAGYERLFRHCDPSSRVVIESTPGYMYSETALQHLPRLPSKPEFIFLLREPVQQLKSLFTYFRGNWDWIPREMTLAEFVKAVDSGTATFRGNELASSALTNADYAGHLRRWQSVCGRERMHIYLFEEILSNKRAFIRDLACRMDIDPAFYNDYAFPAENESYAVKSGLFQRTNLWVRPLIPKGKVYRVLRRIYRTINTKPAPGWRVQDVEIERNLSQRYFNMTMELERDFGIDTTVWRKALMERLRAGDDRLAGPRKWERYVPAERSGCFERPRAADSVPEPVGTER